MSIPPQPGSHPSSAARFAPERFLWAGWQRKIWVVAGLLVGIAVSAVVGSQMPRVYQSSAQISIVKKRPDAVTGVDTRNLSAEENMTPPQEILKSSPVIDRAVRTKGLHALPNLADGEADLTEQIRSSLTVLPAKGPAGQSFVFKLHFRGQDAESCRTVLAALIDSYKEFMDKKHQAISEDTIELILRDKQALEKEIADTDAAYRAFRETAPLLGKAGDGLELRQERLNSIQTKRSALLMQRIELEAQLAALDAAKKGGGSPESVLAMIVEFARKNEGAEPGRDKQLSMTEQLFPLLLEERKLLQLHGAKHPEVLDIRARIEVARRLLLLPPTAWKGESDSSTSVDVDPIKLHVQLLKQKLAHLKISEGLLASVFQTEQDQAKRLAAYEIQNDTLRTRIAMNQQHNEALVKRLKEVSLVRNVGGYQIELIEPPSLGKPVAPSMALIVLAGALIGLGAGFTLAFWAQSAGDSKQMPREDAAAREGQGELICVS